ncbi:hypothetical protein P280DRAFT_509510 [Massarina eburnea CBS 473.64]|uniref:DUF2423 domain-containing protein n=1 Tax=Massarina eburnea CBS 473.64 TaxID=1395130 RepID=A0A6A6RQC4_9PLEO|nr:hypothetical protein P280DRAFT_509510 [Massarina eburnea CBS 473.64]
MAKGLRSSVKKSNRSKLRTRVFQPVEDARLDRLHAKLLAVAAQPKPENPKKNEMEVDTTDGNHPHPHHHPQTLTDADPARPDAAADASKEDEFPKGSSILTASIPPSLCHHATPTSMSKPTPDAVADARMSENLYFMLGLSSDVVGFTSDGHLAFAFDPLPPHWLSDQGLTVAS